MTRKPRHQLPPKRRSDPPARRFIDQVAQAMQAQRRAGIYRRGRLAPGGRAWAVFEYGSKICELVVAPYSTPGLLRITGNAGQVPRSKNMLRRLGYFEPCPTCARRCKRAHFGRLDVCLKSGHAPRPRSWLPDYGSSSFEITCVAEELPHLSALAIEIAQGRSAEELWQVAGYEFLQHRAVTGVSYLWTTAAEVAFAAWRDLKANRKGKPS